MNSNDKNINDNHIDEFQELLEKAQFYILNQKYSEAEKILKKIVAKNDTNAHAFYLYGLAMESSNHHEDAKKHFRRVLELEPNHVEAREHLDRLIGE